MENRVHFPGKKEEFGILCGMLSWIHIPEGDKMTRIRPRLIFLLNFIIGIPACLVILISRFFIFYIVFDMRLYLFSPPDEPPIAALALWLFVIACYFLIPLLVNKRLIADSPYRLKYHLTAYLCFILGVCVGFSFV